FLGLPFLDDMLEVMASERFYNFLHVPVQSGSDAVLQAMERHHTVEDYIHVCERAREILGDVTLSTDVIVGYPTETDEDHRSTVDVLQATRPGHINVTRFSPRPGTPAWGLDELDGGLVKDRSRELSRVRDELQAAHRGRLQGRVVDCTAMEVVVPGTVQARTDAYDPVVLPRELPAGTRVRARITGATKAHAEGEIVEVLGRAAPATPTR
ncbi:MAG: radical SAM protein, partial [Candidatus Thermoplasmatota archaeon]|nr:radical SAM protein [Candidatus Thermoplasmatota archaeon]